MENFLLITVDSLRADHVGWHGYHRETTPHLDEYADAGSRFEKTFAHAGGTRFAFPSILTSVYPMMHGGYEQITDDQTMISEVFQQAGYTTGGFHSNLYLSADFGYDRGWDAFYDSKPNPSTSTKFRSKLKKKIDGTPLYRMAAKVYGFIESTSGVNIGSYFVPADTITDMTLNFVQDVETNNGVFLWVHYMDPHHPFLPPDEYQLLFRDDVVTKRESIKLRAKLSDDPEKVTDEELQTQIDLYDAEIRYTDDQVDRLIRSVRRELGDTVVAFTADHGEHFLERGHFSGAQLYDVKQHVPLFIEGGSWTDDRSYDELVGLVDIPPTLVEQAGLEIPDNFYGYPLQRLVSGRDWPRDNILGGLGVGKPDYACRTTDWNYIWRADGERELYDLNEDPQELRNVFNQYPELVDELHQKIVDHKHLVEQTDSDVSVELDDATKERLRRLGYRE